MRCSWFFSRVLLLTFFTPLYAFQLGIENLTRSFFNQCRNAQGVPLRVGLICNQTSRTQAGERTVDLLRAKGINVVFLLAPEHGFEGTTVAGKSVAHSSDAKTGIAVVSMYGAGGDLTIAGKRIKSEIMEQLDILLYDIQDSGMRHYTYISTLLCALEAAIEHDKPIIVFDRPNYLGPVMEGPLVEPSFKSFISIAPIPVRHGMTIGEIARYFNANLLKKSAKLSVIPMQGYLRGMNPSFLAPLSPNVASLESLYGYSFLGLLAEIRPFEVGIKTPLAFQTIMLSDTIHFPIYEWAKVKALCKKYGIETVHHTATKNRQQYTGLKLLLSPGTQVASLNLLYELLIFFKEHGVPLTFSPLFDKAMGTDLFRKVIIGEMPKDAIESKIRNDLIYFANQAQRSLLYKPLPEIKTFTCQKSL